MKRWLILFLVVLATTFVALSAWARTEVSDAPESSRLGPPEVPTDFSSYDGDWIHISYHPSLKAKVDALQREANEAKRELTELLGKPVLSKVDVVIGRTPGEMETLAPKEARFPRYAAGVAFSERGLVLLTATSRYPGERHDLVEVFRHELAHVALHDAVGRKNVPRWFNEGFAIYASKEAETARLQALWTATLADQLIPLRKLTTSFPADANTASVAYAQAADVLRFLLRGDEAHRFESLIQRLGRGQEFSQALADAYSTDLFSLEKQWKKDVAQRYTFWPIIFGGSLIWIAAFCLMVFAFVKRRGRAQKKLALWAHEEALEDARQRLVQAVFGATGSVLGTQGLLGTQRSLGEQGVVRVVVSTRSESNETVTGQAHQDRAATSMSLPSGFRGVLRPVPTIEHEGQRHILH